MFELFIALFGGLYYAIRTGSEKSAHKQISRATNEEIKQKSLKFDNWISTMVDEELEYNLNKKLKDNPEELFAEIVSDINSLGLYPQVNSYNEFCGEVYRAEFKGKWEYSIPLRMLMAKRGKLLRHDAWFSFPSPGVWDYAEKQKWIRHHKFMIWLDRELQSHGVEPMQFAAGGAFSNARYTGIGQRLDDVTSPIGGSYFWSPSSNYMSMGFIE